mmetsp:Transcript_6782/g.14611  ORF Transcript_6782/g.14611 Transcript_6782/m.14611 type:complete len:222 (-) Transcript_6782:92-757(-)
MAKTKKERLKSKLRAQHEQLVAKHESLINTKGSVANSGTVEKIEETPLHSIPNDAKVHTPHNSGMAEINDETSSQTSFGQKNYSFLSEAQQPKQSAPLSSMKDLEMQTSLVADLASFQHTSPSGDIHHEGVGNDFHLNESKGLFGLSRIKLWINGISDILSDVFSSARDIAVGPNFNSQEYETIVDGPLVPIDGADMYEGMARAAEREHARKKFFERCIIS